MRKPTFPIDTGAKVTAAREYLKLTKPQLAAALRLNTTSNPWQTINRIENGTTTRIPGPTQLAIEHLIEKAEQSEAAGEAQ